jgi:hypothetical protein
MYLWDGANYSYYGARSYAGYPLGDLKSNATELANFVKMYINHGDFNGITMLDSTTIELMTTINDTMLPYGIPIGLIWHYEPLLNLWFHDGATGSCIAFDKDEKTGFVFADNLRHWSDGPQLLICAHFQMMFSELVVSAVHTSDTDGDGIFETGETVEAVTGIFNNLMIDAENVSLTLSCNDPAFIITDSVATLGNISAGQSALNQSQTFSFLVSEITDPHNVMMDVEVNFNNDKTILIHFPLFAGQADLLLVKDERDVLNSERFYLVVLDSLGMKTHYWDVAVNGNPDTTFLKNFPAIIWYTGYDPDSTINLANQMALMNYLDQGGRLFLTGQNISDEIGTSVLMNDYLHTNHSSNVGALSVKGFDGDPVGDGLAFMLNENIFISNQYSQSRLLPLNGGIECFKYGNTSLVSGIRFENDIYKTVFLGFGFESLNLDTRFALMMRVLEYFDLVTGVTETPATGFELSGLSMAPNPANDKITISLLAITSNTRLSIFNVSGEKVLERQLIFTETQLDISTLPRGVYFVRVRNEKMVEVGKMVKE